MSGVSGLLRPELHRHLITTEREFIVLRVPRHGVTRLPGVLLVLAGAGLFLALPFLGAGWWVALFAGLALGLTGFWKIHVQNMDWFVVTNMRVFRVNGVLNQKMASVPLARLLDITVDRPTLGMLLNYGHFVFETAAQEQGLKRISFVKDIEQRHLVLQTVIQRTGVRARAGERIEDYGDVDRLPVPTSSRLSRLRGRLRSRFAPLPDEADPNFVDGT